MSAIATYLAMGGFAAYVWPAYGLAFAVLGGLAVHSWRRYRASKSALAEIERQFRR
ncbi:MAG: heme exporter protein CcmD [Stellaceae bacterium]